MEQQQHTMKCRNLLSYIASLVHLNTVLCAIKCPTHMSGYHGTQGIIRCSINDFNYAAWFEETDEDEPLIRRDGERRSGRGFENGYDVLEDGSLFIKNITFSNDQQYKVMIRKSEDETHTAVVHFSVTGCGSICPPKNGQVNQNASWAQIICDDGFYLNEKDPNTLECICQSGATNRCQWSGLLPTCVAREVTFLPSTPATNTFSTSSDVTTKVTCKITEQAMTTPLQDEKGECSVNENCKTMRIVIIFESISLMVIFIFIVMTKFHIKRRLCSNQNNTSSDNQQPTEGDNMLNREQEQGETST